MVRIKGWKGMAVGLLLLLFIAGPAGAYYDDYGDSESHPLRLAAYALHPAGRAIEWLIIRPLHVIISQPQLEHLFGHRPHESDFSREYAPVATVLPPTVAAPIVPQVAPAPAVPEVAPAPAVLEAGIAAEAEGAAEEAKKAAEEAKKAAQAAGAAAEMAERAFEKTLHK